MTREHERRSACPINACAEIFGDRWSLLVIRDLMMRGARSFKELASAREGIATNMLADRLTKLAEAGIITAIPDPDDGRRVIYRLTEKGIDMAPIIRELAVWATKHEPVRPPGHMKELMARSGARDFVAEVRRRWEDPTLEPLLPPLRPR